MAQDPFDLAFPSAPESVNRKPLVARGRIVPQASEDPFDKAFPSAPEESEATATAETVPGVTAPAAQPVSGAGMTALKAAGEEIGPAAAGSAAALSAGTALLPAAAIPVVGPAIPFVGGAIAGIGTYALAKLGVRKGREALMGKEATQQISAQEQAESQAHPIAASMGGMAGSVPLMFAGGGAIPKIASEGLARTIGRDALTFGIMESASHAGRGVEGTEDVTGKSLLGHFARGGFSGATLGTIGGFIPAAKTVLASMGWKAATDAAVLSTAGALYDHYIDGKPIDPKEIAKQTGEDWPAFAMMNFMTSVGHMPLLRARKAAGTLATGKTPNDVIANQDAVQDVIRHAGDIPVVPGAEAAGRGIPEMEPMVDIDAIVQGELNKLQSARKAMPQVGIPGAEAAGGPEQEIETAEPVKRAPKAFKSKAKAQSEAQAEVAQMPAEAVMPPPAAETRPATEKTIPAESGKAAMVGETVTRPVVEFSGKKFYGEPGDEHADIIRKANRDGAKIPTDEYANEKYRKFETSAGKVVGREAAAKMMGENEPLHSARLYEIQEQQKQEKENAIRQRRTAEMGAQSGGRESTGRPVEGRGVGQGKQGKEAAEKEAPKAAAVVEQPAVTGKKKIKAKNPAPVTPTVTEEKTANVQAKAEATPVAEPRQPDGGKRKTGEIAAGHREAVYKKRLFQGKGAKLEDIYGKEAIEQGRAVPLLGKADYFAENENDAKNYGKVSQHDVELKNPYIIDSDDVWRKLLRHSGATSLDSRGEEWYAHPERIAPSTEKVQKYLRSKGHDGVVVDIPIHADVNDAGDSIQAIAESFGHSQVVRFNEPTAAKQAAGDRSAEKKKAPLFDRIEKIPVEEIDKSYASTNPEEAAMEPHRKRAANQTIEFLDSLKGVEANTRKIGNVASDYVSVSDLEGDYDGVQIRVSDHHQIPGGGFRITDTGEGRAGMSDVDIVATKNGTEIYVRENVDTKRMTEKRVTWQGLFDYLKEKIPTLEVKEPAAKPDAGEAKEPWNRTENQYVSDRIKEFGKTEWQGVDSESKSAQEDLWRDEYRAKIVDWPRNAKISDEVLSSLPDNARDQVIKFNENARSMWYDHNASWNMTYRNFLKTLNEEGRRSGQSAKDLHRTSVKRALEQGKPVPSEVLADYPDLQPAAEKPAPETSAETPPAVREPEESQTFYHGTTRKSGEELKPNALGLIFASTSKDEARVHAGNSTDSRLLNVRITAKNIFDAENPEHLKRIGASDEDRLWDAAYVENADTINRIKAAGFDGVYMRDVGGMGSIGEKNLAVFDRSSIHAEQTGSEPAAGDAKLESVKPATPPAAETTRKKLVARTALSQRIETGEYNEQDIREQVLHVNANPSRESELLASVGQAREAFNRERKEDITGSGGRGEQARPAIQFADDYARTASGKGVKVETDAKTGDKTVSVPAKDKPGIKPSEQKKYLIAELDKAIKDAPSSAESLPRTPESSEAEKDRKLIDGIYSTEKEPKSSDFETTEEFAEAQKKHEDAIEETLGKLFEKYGIKDNIPSESGYKNIDGEITDARPMIALTTSDRHKYLLKKLQTISAEQYPTVKIEVPGDGTFTLKNERGVLQEFRDKKAKKFPVSPDKGIKVGDRAPGAREEKSETSISAVHPRENFIGKEPEAKKLLEPFASQDETRKFIMAPHYNAEAGEVVATDGQRLTVMLGKKGLKKKGAESNWGLITKDDQTYPNYKQIVPGYQEGKMPTVDPGALHLTGIETEPLIRKIRQAMQVGTDKSNSVRLDVDADGKIEVTSNTPDVGEYSSVDPEKKYLTIGTFNPEYLMDTLNFMRHTGNEKIEFTAESSASPVVFRGDKEYTVLMPLRVGEEVGSAADLKSNMERMKAGKEPLTAAEQKEEKKTRREARMQAKKEPAASETPAEPAEKAPLAPKPVRKRGVATRTVVIDKPMGKMPLMSRETDKGVVMFSRDESQQPKPTTAKEETANEITDTETTKLVREVSEKISQQINAPYRFVAIRPDSLQLSASEMGVLRKMEDVFGKKVIFIHEDDKTRYGIGGFNSPLARDILFVNARTTKPHLQIIGHEFLHSLKRDAPDLYENFSRAVEPFVKQSEFEKVFQSFPKVANLDQLGVMEEIHGDVLGNAMLQPKMWNDLEKKNPSLFRQMASYAVKWLSSLKNEFSAFINKTPYAKQFFSDVDSLNSHLTNMLAKYGERKALQRRGAMKETPVTLTDEGVKMAGETPRDMAIDRALKEVDAAQEEVENRITPEQDSAYLEHVNAGRVDEAQRMVDEAAKAAGYTEKTWKGYSEYPDLLSGSPRTGRPLTVIQRPSELPAFNRGEPGVKVAGFFSSDQDVARRFSFGTGDLSTVKRFYLRLGNYKLFDAEGKAAGNVEFGESGRPFRDAIRSGEYDSIVIANTSDEGDVFVTLRPEQSKSADPITRDDQGRVIPLSERFNPKTPDIRFSLPSLLSPIESDGVRWNDVTDRPIDAKDYSIRDKQRWASEEEFKKDFTENADHKAHETWQEFLKRRACGG